jgi:hypothetical protein
MIHDSPLAPVWKSRPIDGSARLTAVMSIPTSKTLTQQTASTTPRRAGLARGTRNRELMLTSALKYVSPTI